MKQYGLRIPPDQRARILDYLGTYLGPNPPPGMAETASMPAPAKVDGAAIYEDQCSGCHQEKGEGVPSTFRRSPATAISSSAQIFPRASCCSA